MLIDAFTMKTFPLLFCLILPVRISYINGTERVGNDVEIIDIGVCLASINHDHLIAEERNIVNTDYVSQWQ